MTHPTLPAKPRASAWAVALLVLSSGFALVALALFSMDFSPV